MGAAAGSAEAQFAVGMLLLNGERMEKDAEQAVQLLSRSAAQGNEEAMLQLGLCYLSGDGVPEDAEKAFSVFEKAAQSGNAEAVNMLGRCYMDGRYRCGTGSEKGFRAVAKGDG